MGDSQTPKPTPKPEGTPAQDAVTQAIAAWPLSLEPGQFLGVALSGGADSTALLLACQRRWPGRVVALHVNHGLQSAAADFEAHCQNLCVQLNIPLRVLHAKAFHASGESPEDAARKARYNALAQLCQGQGAEPVIEHVALGQHADDQVETLLLALSRGAGLPGLSAMPAQFERHGLRFHRPLLAVAGADLRAWLLRRGVSHIEDPSNVDQRFTRNRIRAQLLPVLGQVFPQFRTTFARSSAHAAQAQALLLELAQADLAQVGCPPALSALQQLSRARQANVLRHWLGSAHGEHARPNTAQLNELISQIAACTTRGHQLHIKVGTGFVVRQGAQLTWAPSA
jgi:tRNA(Ile)-lysidine synthase